MIPYNPPITWRIRVWNGNAWNQGSPKETLTPDNGPVSIDALNLTPQGDSLDGSFTLVPAGLNVAARDTITVDTHDGSGWVPRYAGVITTAGNPRSTDRQTYRTAGIRQRLFETINQLAYVDAGDVAAQVRAVLAMSQHQPAGMTYTAGDVPTQGFELGPRATALETVGDFLDAMAGFVGSFAVPTGQTYTYDGHTYQAGEIVPPTQWGVKPDGSIYFRRPAPGSAAVFSEGDQRTTIEWAPINAEDATGDVLLTYIGAINTQDVDFQSAGFDDPNVPIQDRYYETAAELAAMYHVARLNGRRPLTTATTPSHLTRVQVDGPLDLMDALPPAQMSASLGGGVTNPSNAIDGDPDTYATMTDPSSSLFVNPPANDYRDGVWRLTYSLKDSDNTEALAICRTNLLAPPLSPGSVSVRSRLRDTQGEKRTIYLPSLLTAYIPPAYQDPWSRNSNQVITISRRTVGVTPANFHFRIYEAAYMAPDCDLYATDAGKAGSRSARYADAHRREPAPEVARITYHGDGPQTHEIQVRPLTGGTIQAWTERITLAMTTAAGITTTYHAGQEWPAQVQEQRILLERLARRSVQGGGRRR